ncbi:flippase-like domain-containing protein [bacterium]|nr:flippase-like domain-containing protein [bacterium]
MKKLLLFLISLLVGIGLFIWVGKIVGWSEIKNVILIFTRWQGLIIFSLTILIILIGNWKWKEILKEEGVEVSFGELLKPYLVGFSVVFLAPIVFWGGELFRSYVLKKKNSVPWYKGITSVIIDRISGWVANLTVIFFGIIFFCLFTNTPLTKLRIVLGTVFLIFVLFIIIFCLKKLRKESLIKLFIKNNHKGYLLKVEKEFFKFFNFKKKRVWKIFTLAFLRVVLSCFQVWVLVIFLGKNLGFFSVVSILGFFYLAEIIPIPAALGSHEAFQFFSFTSLGLPPSTVPAFTMIIRTVDLTVALLGIIILFHLGIGFFKDALFNNKKIKNLFNN